MLSNLIETKQRIRMKEGSELSGAKMKKKSPDETEKETKLKAVTLSSSEKKSSYVSEGHRG